MLDMYSTRKDFQDAECETAVLPVGAVEQHGSHLPVGTDSIIASAFAQRIAKRLGAYLLPVLSITSSIEHRNAKGTVYLKANTLSAVIRDVADSLQHSGFKRLIIVNTHGGNWILKPTVRQLNRDFLDSAQDMEVVLLHSSVAPHRLGEVMDHVQHDIHAGESETSIMMYLCKENVRPPVPQSEPTIVPQDYMDYFDISELTEDGYWGFPDAADEEKGRKMMELMEESAIDYLQRLNEHKKRLRQRRT